MIINLSPVRGGPRPTFYRSGDSLLVNGEEFDFSQLTEGATLPAEAINSPHFIGDMTRTNGEIVLNIICTHGKLASDAARRPDPVVMSDSPRADGYLPLPPYEGE